MRHFSAVLIIVTATAMAHAQAKPKVRPTPVSKPAGPAVVEIDKGKVSGRTYTNRSFGFEVTFPDTWLIPDGDFEAYMLKQGFDLRLKAPDALPPAQRTAVNRALKRVHVLLTAYRSMPGMADNAIVRISLEDLALNPQIKDAVDYFDAMRAVFRTMKLPPDFKYTETDAEQLGAQQFAWLGVDSNAGKKRMYATVRNGFAVMFTISYTSDADLEVLRDVLAKGDFALK